MLQNLVKMVKLSRLPSSIFLGIWFSSQAQYQHIHQNSKQLSLRLTLVNQPHYAIQENSVMSIIMHNSQMTGSSFLDYVIDIGLRLEKDILFCIYFGGFNKVICHGTIYP